MNEPKPYKCSICGAEVEKARDEDRKKIVIQQICTELMIHSMVEEEIFYPACNQIRIRPTEPGHRF